MMKYAKSEKSMQITFFGDVGFCQNIEQSRIEKEGVERYKILYSLGVGLCL